jgi:hypothetical protein
MSRSWYMMALLLPSASHGGGHIVRNKINLSLPNVESNLSDANFSSNVLEKSFDAVFLVQGLPMEDLVLCWHRIFRVSRTTDALLTKQHLLGYDMGTIHWFATHRHAVQNLDVDNGGS